MDKFSIITDKFYKLVDPNQTESKNGVVYFNADRNDNMYMESLVDRYVNYSSIHSNFINLKRRLTYGSGLLPVDADNVKLQEFIDKENSAGNDINEVLQKCVLDYAILESCAVQVIYSANGKAATVFHTDMSKLRAEEPDEFGMINAYWFSKDWSKVKGSLNDKRMKNSPAVRIPVYNPETGTKDARQILVIKRYTTGNPIYPIPSYNSSLPYIDLDYLLAKHHLNAVNGGFFPTFLLNLVGNPTEEEKKKFISEFNNKFTGTENIKGVYFWSDTHDAAPKFERMSEDTNEKLFETLQKQVYTNVSTGHGGSLALAGFESQGADLGGDANKLNVERLSFINRVIEDFQATIVRGFNKIFDHNDLGEAHIVNSPLKLAQPAEQPTDLTTDERRDWLYGLPPLSTTQETEVKEENNV